jgi:hypothetical protein
MMQAGGPVGRLVPPLSGPPLSGPPLSGAPLSGAPLLSAGARPYKGSYDAGAGHARYLERHPQPGPQTALPQSA